MTIRSGQCLCGRVTYQVQGEPLQVGRCHCTDCRKESGSVFTTFAIWPRHAFSSSGETAVFAGRSFCSICGSRLFNLTDAQAEIRIGSLHKAPTDLRPTYEVWTKRREHWVDPLPDGEGFKEDRPD